jgi:2-polyprenyl-3-methyl-5-hydroxy-6-metoxy-1,4-benzoquinol methylase
VELSWKGISNAVRGLKQKWGSSRLKRDMWDKEYESGRWKHCEVTPRAYVYTFVEKYCRGGSILDLGCGSGNTGNEIDVAKFDEYTGIDISTVAVQKALARSEECGRAAKNRYFQGDVESYDPRRKFDVILFRESIYYISYARIRPTLDRYHGNLSDNDGVFIVNLSRSTTNKCEKILSLLEASYSILEKSAPDHDTYILVFR